MIPLLITRPEPDASRFAQQVAAALPDKFEPILSPMLEVVPEPVTLMLDSVQALLFTSANGVRCFATMSDNRDIPAICVGAGTTREAEMHGLAASSAGGDVSDLAAMAAMSYQEGGGHYLHLRGREAAGDLVGSLLGEGCAAEEQIIYDQRALTLSETARQALKGTAAVVLPVFSPRTAALLADDIAAMGPSAPVHLVALSRNVAQALAPLAGAAIAVTTAPDLDAMLQALSEF